MAARIEAYLSYSKIAIRTVLIEANEIIKRGEPEKKNKEDNIV